MDWEINWNTVKSAIKKISPELEAVKSLSELVVILKKNEIEIGLGFLSCSCDDSCMYLSGCVSSKNPFNVRTTISHFVGDTDGLDFETFGIQTLGVPLLAEEELEAWEKSYVARLKKKLLKFGKA